MNNRIFVPHNGLIYYTPCNIYLSVEWGNNCKVGAFTEIGNNVVIGNNVIIGAFCFIPEGVTIEDDCWIGPRVTFTNDKYPPSLKEKWGKTIVRKGARLGAAVTVLCGLEIGEGALIGAGSVVTKNVPSGETWCGVPAENIRKVKSGKNRKRTYNKSPV